VLSPHLDDGVLSLGGTIAKLARRGVEVLVVTAFGGEIDSDRRAGWWDRLAGFESAAEAFRARRAEDRKACATVGAKPVWLPFLDGQYEQPRATPEFVAAFDAACAGADAVLIPGFPLVHEDHAWLTCFILDHGLRQPRVGLYGEQPYLWRRGVRPELAEALAPRLSAVPNWGISRLALRDRLAKRHALQAYASQKRLLGRFAFLRVMLSERRRGGESIAWLDQ
jgi:LmbE family N-acetylglucosaminyl deacetylase